MALMPGRILRSKLFRAGAVLFAIGCSPLLLYALFELVTGRTGGNPIGLGLLFFVTFWPSVILMLAGALLSLRKEDEK